MIENCLTPLFVPADRPERFAKAAASGADAIILDLEDAVSPDRKDMARRTLATPGVIPQDIPVIVRVNASSTPWQFADIETVARLPVAGVMVPKASRAEELTMIAGRLGNRRVIALIETPRGLAAVQDIARAGRVARLAFGSVDFCAEMGCAHTREALLSARSAIIFASALHGLPPPLDGVTAAFSDDAAARADARHAVEMGFGGKLCIHPRQIAAVLDGFAPSVGEIEWAHRVLAGAREGATVTDGAMVDAPVRARAALIIARQAKMPRSAVAWNASALAVA
ncbi:MAG: HpcH/HpaI aldolase [Sphingomonas bacterium]|nr:HpcH/HpaI aldolase [Sphingomonas bacterium]